MVNKVCYNCVHIRGTSGWSGTDVTPGDSMSLTCDKGHWYFDPPSEMYSDIIPTLKECLEYATSCPDFTTQEHKNETDTIIEKQRSKRRKAFYAQATTCNKCGSFLHTYNHQFTHCPKCSPVDSVIDTDTGLPIQPMEVK